MSDPNNNIITLSILGFAICAFLFALALMMF